MISWFEVNPLEIQISWKLLIIIHRIYWFRFRLFFWCSHSLSHAVPVPQSWLPSSSANLWLLNPCTTHWRDLRPALVSSFTHMTDMPILLPLPRARHPPQNNCLSFRSPFRVPSLLLYCTRCTQFTHMYSQYLDWGCYRFSSPHPFIENLPRLYNQCTISCFLFY